jgi:uncharacterized protein YkwD
MRRKLMLSSVFAATFLTATPSFALDLNSYRAAHHKPPLALSSELSGIAAATARDLASRNRLDHRGFRDWAAMRGTASAENVLVGCANEDCAIRGWARSAGHRRNMLRGDVSRYGIGSATSAKGRTYWVLELGNE